MPQSLPTPAPALDATRCPLCGASNGCAMAAASDAATPLAAQDCWCQVTDIAPGVLERLPEALRGQACICARCAQG